MTTGLQARNCRWLDVRGAVDVEQLSRSGPPERPTVLLADPLDQHRLDPAEQRGVDLAGDSLLHRLDGVQPLPLHRFRNGVLQVAIGVGAGTG